MSKDIEKDENLNEPIDLDEEESAAAIAEAPSEVGDPPEIVQAKIPKDIQELYDVYSYRSAAVILSETRKEEFGEILSALRTFRMTKNMICRAGGNESEIPKVFSNILRPLGWYETIVQGDLIVTKTWRGVSGTIAKGKNKGKPKFAKISEQLRREKFLDGHKIDYVKGRVAFDLEWNSKDQTFDRDLYAFSAFAQTGVIDVGVLLTRSESLNPIFKKLGPALKKDGKTVEKKPNGEIRMTYEKYGASTTWMGKLLYRLNAGRNGGCPVLALGIKPNLIEDWTEEYEVASG